MKHAKLFLLSLWAIFAVSCNQDQEVIDDIIDRQNDVTNTNVDFSISKNDRTATFTINGDDKLTSFKWEFGDGKEVKDFYRSVTHTYEADGTYQVKLTAYWKYKGVTQYKEITHQVVINNGANPGGQQSTKKAYIAGFKITKIPADNYYYSLKLVINEGTDYTLTTTTPDKELKTTDLPYTYWLDDPVLLEGKNSFDYYGEFVIHAYKHFYFWSSPDLFFYEFAYANDLKGKTSYTYGGGNSTTEIIMFINYED